MAGVTVTPMMPAECFALARPRPDLPPPGEGPIRVRRLNDGTLAWRRLLHPDRDDQAAALWIPDGVGTVRGVIAHMHRASEAARTDLQAVARCLNFAVYAMRVRWSNYERVLPDQLDKLGTRLGHPEIANVPWAAIGGSRNAAAFCCYAVRDPNPDRILCILTNGGPGIAVDLGDRRARARFRGIPILSVNGTEDPYVEGLDWFRDVYPRIRRARLPWCAAPDWGGGHAGLTNGALYWPFLKAVVEARYPADADPRRERIRLKPFPAQAGRVAAPVDWNEPGPGCVVRRPGGGAAAGSSVWMPSAAVFAVWRAYAAHAPVGRLRVKPGRARGAVELELPGADARRAAAVRFYNGDRLLGVRRSRPFRLAAQALARGLHAVYAESLDAEGRHIGFTRPVVVADGVVVDQKAGLRAADGIGERITAIRCRSICYTPAPRASRPRV